MNPYLDANVPKSWVESVKVSLPAHASWLEKNLVLAMTQHGLSEVDAHSVALAAAIASGNGELAFEISMNGPLFGKDERDAVAQAVAAQSVDSVFHHYLDAAEKVYATVSTPKFQEDLITSSPKHAIYRLAAALVFKTTDLTPYVLATKDVGYTAEQIQDIAGIVAVIASINKIVI